MIMLVTVICSIGLPASASNYISIENEPPAIDETFINADGSYYVITLTVDETRASKTGAKTYTYYSSDDVIQWKVRLQGSFTYNGSTSTCTNASHSVTIYNDAWYVYTQNSYKSGNKAIADVTMKKKFLGVVTSTRDVHIELACDKNGNLS